MSTMIVTSCDDEPPEPLIEGIPDDFSAITLIKPGIVSKVSVRRLLALRSLKVSPKSRKRDFSALRSCILLTTCLDNRAALRCFASAWRSSVRSITYKSPCWETPRTEKASAADLILAPDAPPTSAAMPEPVVTNRALHEHKSAHTLEREPLCVPLIVITPPSSLDVDWASYNAIPTPQNVARGSLLTVPDRDAQMDNRCGHGRTLSGRNYFTRPRPAWTKSASKESSGGKRLPSVIAPIGRTMFVEEEDDDVDLGPTWSG